MLPEGLGNAIHLLAAVLWIGGLAVLVLGLRPALQVAVPDEDRRDQILAAIHRRFHLLAGVSAVVLFASGFMMMATDEHFEGIGRYAALWPKLMAVKHLLFAGLLAVLVVSRRTRGPKPDRDLIDLSLMLGVAVLVLTGLLTAVK